jgi:hypothetical protein
MLVPDLDSVITILDEKNKPIVQLGDGAPSNLRDHPRADFIPGKFIHPHDAIFLPNGHVCVADCDNFRMQIVSRDGYYVGEVRLDGGTSCPTGLAASGDWLYVVEHGAHRLSKLRRSCTLAVETTSRAKRWACVGSWGGGDAELARTFAQFNDGVARVQGRHEHRIRGLPLELGALLSLKLLALLAVDGDRGQREVLSYDKSNQRPERVHPVCMGLLGRYSPTPALSRDANLLLADLLIIIDAPRHSTQSLLLALRVGAPRSLLAH